MAQEEELRKKVARDTGDDTVRAKAAGTGLGEGGEVRGDVGEGGVGGGPASHLAPKPHSCPFSLSDNAYT
jgi:hypothetical protein